MDTSCSNLDLIALLGSGETAAAGGQAFEFLAERLGDPLSVSILEHPRRIRQLNSAMVAGRVADYIKVRLQNYHPDVHLVPARQRGTTYSRDNPDLLEGLLHSRLSSPAR